MNNRFGRRAFVKSSMAASAICGSFGGLGSAFVLAPRAVPGERSAIQQRTVTVAALQSDGSGIVECALREQLGSLREWAGSLDLIVIGRHVCGESKIPSDCLTPLRDFVRQTNCHIVVPTRRWDRFRVLRPGPDSVAAVYQAGTTIPTEIGALSLGNLGGRERAVLSREIDIRITYTDSGYDRRSLAEYAEKGGTYTLIVASPPVRKMTGRVCSGTALYSPAGRALTEASGGWNQAIIGKLHLPAPRSMGG